MLSGELRYLTYHQPGAGESPYKNSWSHRQIALAGTHKSHYGSDHRHNHHDLHCIRNHGRRRQYHALPGSKSVAVRIAIAARLKHRRLGAHTVQVKVRYSDFTTLTRQISVEEPIIDAADIYRLGCFLLGREKLVSRPLRLLGLGVSSLREPAGQQLVLL